jgi:DUF1365 family protein
VTALAADPRSTSARPAAGEERGAALYHTWVRHVRTTPLRNAFTYRSYQWLVDLDALPTLPRMLRPFARFESGDHLGDPTRSLRDNVDAYLAEHGIDLGGGTIRMLTNARVLGYVFNPLTVYWCHLADGTLRCVIAEVHNTYRQRHRYLLRTDDRGRAEVGKEFYVSPFYEVAGRYTMSLPEPAETLQLSITLHPLRGATFVASVRGERRSAHGLPLLRLLLGQPWATAAVSARIRCQGIKLYLRGLPVFPRPSSSITKGQA